jgi:hypothetical protein
MFEKVNRALSSVRRFRNGASKKKFSEELSKNLVNRIANKNIAWRE